ncbi:hypothetical protein AR687_22805 [Flavobacteriaceae bacterium CRH]|nr:hypothetical protein AR687_22805 [Flavobacteriaceae bacterium CRH]
MIKIVASEHRRKKRDFELKELLFFVFIKINDIPGTFYLPEYVKREAAYFGDTLNICSRLQKTCKERNVEMIISESFFSK